MAKLTKSVLGKVSGAVGDLVFRMRNNSNFICTRPVSFMPGTDQASIDRRARFGLSCKFARSVNKVAFLKKLWDIFTPNNMLPVTGIMRANYTFVTPNDVTSAASMVPDIGFDLPTQTVMMGPVQVQVVTEPIGSGSNINPATEPQVQLAGVIFLKSPKSDKYRPVEFLSITFSKQTTSLTDPLTFVHTMSDVESAIFSRYNSAKGFFALASLNTDDTPVNFSSTVISP